MRSRPASRRRPRICASRGASSPSSTASWSNLTRLSLVTELDDAGRPRPHEAATGARMNVRASLSEDRERVRVEIEAGFSRLTAMEKRTVGESQIHVPTFAIHVVRATESFDVGKRVVLCRIGGTKIDAERPDIVVLVRCTVVGGKR